MQKLRAEYWTTIGEVNLADLVFIDEAGVNIAMTRHFARSAKGSREDWRSPRRTWKKCDHDWGYVYVRHYRCHDMSKEVQIPMHFTRKYSSFSS